MKSGMDSRRSLFQYLFLSFLLIFGLISSVAGQGVPQSPYRAPSVLRGGLDLAPSNPLGLPGSTGGLPRGSDSIFLSPALLEGILPPIPNLEIGYLYNFGSRVQSTRFTLDYVLPVDLSEDSALFGEAHSEWHNFWKTVRGLIIGYYTLPGGPNAPDTRADISLGGGYRRLFHQNCLIGINGFYDASWLGGNWYSSGSVGGEMVALLSGNDALDLNFNWYGNLLSAWTLRNAFRKGPSNYDFEVGYSHELWDGGPDLRLKATGYKFSIGSNPYGWNAGAEVTSRNGAFSLKCETGHDRINNTYHTVGGFVNVGLQLERLLSGESPFVMPEPIFRSPRNLRRWLSRKVRRNWFQPASVVQDRAARVYFVVDVEEPTLGSFTGQPASGSAATWTVNTVNLAGTHNAVYRRYSLRFAGDLASLPPSVPVTVTWQANGGVIEPHGVFNWFNGQYGGTITVNAPVPDGGTIGDGGTLADSGPDDRPWIRIRTDLPDTRGLCGTVTFSAPGVTTLTITVVRP